MRRVTDPKKPKEHKNKIGPGDLTKVLIHLGLKPSKPEVNLMLWVNNSSFTFKEVDDDLDGFVSQTEYEIMYKRCISDETGLEPRKLFNLVQFLMYDKTFKGRVTVEETLQILYVRYGRGRLDDEIKAIFGEDEKNAEGSEKEITYGEYVEKINKRALEEQKKIIQAR